MAQSLDDSIIATAEQIYRDWLNSGLTFGDALERAVRAGVRLSRADQLPRMSGLTPRLRQLVAFIEAYVDKHGFCPSYDEMAKAIGLAAKSGVKRMLDELEERGVVQRIPYRSRAVTLLGRAYELKPTAWPEPSP